MNLSAEATTGESTSKNSVQRIFNLLIIVNIRALKRLLFNIQ